MREAYKDFLKMIQKKISKREKIRKSRVKNLPNLNVLDFNSDFKVSLKERADPRGCPRLFPDSVYLNQSC
jgi:hypothetical protein